MKRLLLSALFISGAISFATGQVAYTSFEEPVVAGQYTDTGDAGVAHDLINNAGDIPSGSLFDIDEESWRRGWELKVFGYINLCRGFYPMIKKNGGGVIINNIGNGGEIYDPLYIAGAAGNSGLMSFTKALGGNSLEDNIRVIGVNPGPVETERIYKILKNRSLKLYGDENHVQELLKRYPLGRPAHVREISDLIAFLVSEKSGYTSGTVFTVDGGISSRSSII